MNNGKAFPSLDGMTCSNPWHDQPQFLPWHWQAKKYWISWDHQTPNLLEKNSNNSRNNMKSQKGQKYKFVESVIPTLNKFISYQFLLILLKGANHEQSSENNKSFSQQFRRMVARLPIFVRKSRYWTLKWYNLRISKIFSWIKKIYRNLLKCLTLSHFCNFL